MMGAWALDLMWAPVVCVIAQGVYWRRKAAGLYEDITPPDIARDRRMRSTIVCMIRDRPRPTPLGVGETRMRCPPNRFLSTRFSSWRYGSTAILAYPAAGRGPSCVVGIIGHYAHWTPHHLETGGVSRTPRQGRISVLLP